MNPDVNLLTRTQEVKYYVGYEFLKGLENRFYRVMCLSGCSTLYRRHVLIEVEEDLIHRSFLGQDVKYGEDRFRTRKILRAWLSDAAMPNGYLLHESSRDLSGLVFTTATLAAEQ